MNNYIRKQKGITLIALVITIIVLLILAGVSIAMLTGENGLIKKAGEASKNTNKCKEVEQARLDIMSVITEKGGENPTEREVKVILGKYFENVPINIDDLEQELITKDGRHEVKLSEILDGVTIKEDYIGCYADIDNDGEVDGIIYADMKVGNTKSGIWYSEIVGNRTYSMYNIPIIEDKTSIKSYDVSTKTYEGQTTPGKYKFNDGFGEKDVIVPIENSPGTKDRFYVMKLNDFTTSNYSKFYWGKKYNKNLDDYSDSMMNDFGKGKIKTINEINRWNEKKYGEQHEQDIWGAIQDRIGIIEENEIVTDCKWFIPSKSEWCACGEELGINMNNYQALGFGNYENVDHIYLSSSQGRNVCYYGAFMFYPGVRHYALYSHGPYFARLSTTF